METKLFDFREDKLKAFQREKELETERKLTKSLRAEIELLRKKIQQLEVEDGYKRLEIKSLRGILFKISKRLISLWMKPTND